MPAGAPEASSSEPVTAPAPAAAFAASRILARVAASGANPESLIPSGPLIAVTWKSAALGRLTSNAASFTPPGRPRKALSVVS
jgi:hypothetical protein